MEYSLLEKHFDRYEREAKVRAEMAAASPWTEEGRRPDARAKRVLRALDDYWFFDRTYFPEEMYRQGYSKPGKFHRALVKIDETPGGQIVLGSRKGAKSKTSLKRYTYKAIKALLEVGGVMSQHLPVAQQLLDDIYQFVANNPRIMEDFQIEFVKANEDQLRFTVRLPDRKPHTVLIRPYSEGRSVRGFSAGFIRPTYILCDDLETRLSPLGADHTDRRAAILAEAKSSLTDDGTLLVLGNNFDEQTLMNKLLREQEQGILADDWHVHVFPAWHPKRGSFWPERYPAKSEAEMRRLMKPADEAEWLGDYQQKPAKPDGWIFKRSGYHTYRPGSTDPKVGLPKDARGILWCDPNLAKKSRGDTAALLALLYSPATMAFYIYRALCRSYSDSNVLLNDLLSLLDDRIFRVGFDGNVNQESTWTNNIRNWCAINGRPYPYVDYKHFHVDLLAKNAQGFWNEGKYRWPEGFEESEDGSRFLQQVFAFQGKSANGRDDAPDALISATEFIISTGFVRARRRMEHSPVISVVDNYSF